MKLPKTKKQWSLLVGAVLLIVAAIVKFAGCELDLSMFSDAADVVKDSVPVVDAGVVTDVSSDMVVTADVVADVVEAEKKK